MNTRRHKGTTKGIPIIIRPIPIRTASIRATIVVPIMYPPRTLVACSPISWSLLRTVSLANPTRNENILSPSFSRKNKITRVKKNPANSEATPPENCKAFCPKEDDVRYFVPMFSSSSIFSVGIGRLPECSHVDAWSNPAFTEAAFDAHCSLMLLTMKYPKLAIIAIKLKTAMKLPAALVIRIRSIIVTSGDSAEASMIAMITGMTTSFSCTNPKIITLVRAMTSRACADRVAILPNPVFQDSTCIDFTNNLYK